LLGYIAGWGADSDSTGQTAHIVQAVQAYIKPVLGSMAFCPDPDQTPDPTSFFTDFKDAKKKIFVHIFFL
jgi:hypothetical protein